MTVLVAIEHFLNLHTIVFLLVSTYWSLKGQNNCPIRCSLLNFGYYKGKNIVFLMPITFCILLFMSWIFTIICFIIQKMFFSSFFYCLIARCVEFLVSAMDTWLLLLVAWWGYNKRTKTLALAPGLALSWARKVRMYATVSSVWR